MQPNPSEDVRPLLAVLERIADQDNDLFWAGDNNCRQLAREAIRAHHCRQVRRAA